MEIYCLCLRSHLKHHLIGLFDVKFIHQFTQNALREFEHDLVIGLADASGGHPRLNVEDCSDQRICLLSLYKKYNNIYAKTNLLLIQQNVSTNF